MTRITEKDLRIGNLIASGKEFSDTSTIGKVLSIGCEDCDFEQVWCECEESFEWFFKDNYCGIPLTEEWLVKLGFTDNSNESSLIFYFDMQTFRLAIAGPRGGSFDLFEMYGIDTEGEYTPSEISLLKPLRHVHEVQNFLYALTGKELELKG